MAHAIPRPPVVTRGMALGTAAVVAFTLALASLGHDAPTDPARAGERPLAARDLAFEDRADGAVLVRDARTGAVIETLEPGSEGFVRASMRGLVRQRRLAGLGAEQPFRLSTWPDGRITLLDTATGHTMELHAFGRTNAEAYLKLLATGE
jgi:putative photosynthetic complex assembly protein